MKKRFTVRTPNERDWNWFTCSSASCFEKYLDVYKKLIKPNYIDLDKSITDDYVKSMFTDSFWQSLSEGQVNEFHKKEKYIVFEGMYAEGTSILLRKHIELLQAHNLERAGRFKEAAEIYDRWNMFDKAGRLREKEKQVMVKRTDVSVDLNKLIQQVRDGGLVVIYRCPHCSAPLKINKDSNVKSLKMCEHCGSEIETMDLADFLRTALS